MNSTKRARHLRKEMTEAEKKVWQFLKAKKFCGLKFRRQEPIGKYIVDFVCYLPRIIIEIDGGQHASEILEQDKIRDSWLESQSFRVLRFWNNEVMENCEGVMEVVFRALPQPLPQGEGKN